MGFSDRHYIGTGIPYVAVRKSELPGPITGECPGTDVLKNRGNTPTP